MADEKRPSLMRNIGQFFGHVAKGVKTKGPERQVVRREVEEEQREGEGGRKVTLRRTTIEEIEVEPGDHAGC
jgi:hypothetical protein